MTLSEFTSSLSKGLTERGISEDKVSRHIAKFLLALAAEDMTEIENIQTVDDMKEIIEEAAKHLSAEQPHKAPEVHPNVAEVSSEAIDKKPNENDSGIDISKNEPASTSAEADKKNNTPEDDVSQYAPSEELFSTGNIDLDKTGYTDNRGFTQDNIRIKTEKLDWKSLLPEINETPEGKKKFIKYTIIFSPLFLIAGIIYYAAWALLFTAEIALIAALIALLVGTASIGALSAVGGIIYGIVNLSSVSCVGIYEIGFGIILGGCTILSCVLIYNLALRFIPFVVRKTGDLSRFCYWKCRIALRNYRGGFSK